MVGCMTREIHGPDARLAYTAAVRLREEIRGARCRVRSGFPAQTATASPSN